MKRVIKIALFALVAFALIQLIPIDRSNAPVMKSENFVEVNNTSPEVVRLLRAACYDCHSNEVQYPDYAYVAPISWMVKDHISQGRERLNFSKWGTYNTFQKQGMLENSIQTVESYTMPLPSYIQKHPEANLTKSNRDSLVAYFRLLLKDKTPLDPIN